MKTIYIWFTSIQKRLLRKPLFIFTLFLIPLFVLLLRFSLQEGDATFQVALYTSSTNVDSLEHKIIQNLLDTPNTAITYHLFDTEEEIKEKVLRQEVNCGYIFPENLEEQLIQYEKTSTPVIKAFHNTSDFSYHIMDEILFGKLYKQLSFHILTSHVEEKQGTVDTTALHELRESYIFHNNIFTFEYFDGSQNLFISNSNSNYMMLPVRGIIAVLILLSGMIGTLFWYEDKENHLFSWMTTRKEKRISFLYILVPTCMACIIGFGSILLSGLNGQLGNEMICMVFYAFLVLAFCNVLKTLLPTKLLFLCSIPIFIVGSFIVCPIFINLTAGNPILLFLNKLSPVTYYLSSLYSVKYKFLLLLIGCVLFLFALITSYGKKK